MISEFRVTVAPAFTWKMRELPLPLISMPLASAEASMVTLLLKTIWPLVSTIGWPESPAAKVIVEPAARLVTALRRLPGPESAGLVTGLTGIGMVEPAQDGLLTRGPLEGRPGGAERESGR